MVRHGQGRDGAEATAGPGAELDRGRTGQEQGWLPYSDRDWVPCPGP